MPRGSPADKKRPGGRQHRGADLIELAIAQQPRRRSVLKLRVKALKPRLSHAAPIDLLERQRSLQSDPHPALYKFPGGASAIGPLANSAGLGYSADVGGEARTQDLTQLPRDFGERGARSYLMRLKVGSRSGRLRAFLLIDLQNSSAQPLIDTRVDPKLYPNAFHGRDGAVAGRGFADKAFVSSTAWPKTSPVRVVSRGAPGVSRRSS
jgi:hypothetical protein